MKKITLVSLASCFFLFIASGIAIITRSLFSAALPTFLIGLGVLIASGVASLFTKESIKLNILCFAFSAVAMGILIRAWYLVRGLDNSIATMCLVSLAAVLYLWVFFALSRIPLFRSSHLAYIIFVIFFLIISAVAYLVIMLNTKTSFVSTFGFYMIIELGFIFAMSLEVDSPAELIMNITHSTYSIFIVAIVVGIFVLIAVAGGDGCDCDCDCGSCDGDCGCDACDCGGSSDTAAAKTKKKKGAVKIDLE